MRRDVFIDSNVLLYLVDADPAKAERVEKLLIEGGVINAFVLAETAYVMVRRWKRPWQDASAVLAAFRANTIIHAMTDETVARGMQYGERFGLQPYDAMIVAAAVLAGCTTLLSEDMHDGLVVDGLTIRNPFRT